MGVASVAAAVVVAVVPCRASSAAAAACDASAAAWYAHPVACPAQQQHSWQPIVVVGIVLQSIPAQGAAAASCAAWVDVGGAPAGVGRAVALGVAFAAAVVAVVLAWPRCAAHFGGWL